MPQLKNPVTGAVVTVASGQEQPYLDLKWTVVNDASTAGFAGSGIAPSGTGQQPTPTVFSPPPAGVEFSNSNYWGVNPNATPTPVGSTTADSINKYYDMLGVTGQMDTFAINEARENALNSSSPTFGARVATSPSVVDDMYKKYVGRVATPAEHKWWDKWYNEAELIYEFNKGTYGALVPGIKSTVNPASTTGVKILNETDLQAKRNELAKAGIPQSEWSKYISSPGAGGVLYWTQPATLTSPTGEKKVVPVGSQEASNLLNQGWTLGDKVGGGTITTESFTGEPKLNLGNIGGTTGGTSLADQAIANYQASVDNYFKMQEAGNSLDKKAKDDMFASLMKSLQTDVSQESMQLAENAKYGISDIDKAKAEANTELQLKLAEIKGLDANYLKRKNEIGKKVITMGRMSGQMTQEDKDYMIEKNLLTSEASLIQAKYLGLSGQLEAAQKAADRAVDLKYADQMYKTNNQIKMLELLQGQVDEENENYRWAMTQALEDKRTALNQQMDYKKMILNSKLDLIAKYPDAGISLNDTDAQARAKLAGSKIYQDQIRPPVSSTTITNSYFTRPKADGTIGYYFGNERNPSTAQEISKEQYNSGVYKDTDSDTGDTFTDTVNHLKSLRDKGQLTDFGYREQINALMQIQGYGEDRRGEVESMVNQAMEGRVPTQVDLSEDNNPASDFTVVWGSPNMTSTPSMILPK